MIEIDNLKAAALDVLNNNILSFWLGMQDNERGGFYGRMDGHGTLCRDAEKGAVLNARILWSFAAAYRVTGNGDYLAAATRARNYILEHFIDRQYGGVYWSLDADGKPVDMKKQSYAIGFMIYGMSEYARATGDKVALDTAIELYRSLEEHAYDSAGDGYIEALTRDWQPLDDMRLSELDENGSRTQNTHLHIIEPYTNLYRVWPDEGLRVALMRLLHIFTDKLMNAGHGHIDLFFDDRWQGRRDIQSYGHDIEASWLLHETALVLGDKEILDWIEPKVVRIAEASRRGLLPNGALRHEAHLDGTRHDYDLHWWVQCENIIGNLNLYQHFGDETALRTALSCWQWIEENLIDRENGEWHWSVREDGTLNLDDDKAGFWKCPYHNTRLCLEILERGFLVVEGGHAV